MTLHGLWLPIAVEPARFDPKWWCLVIQFIHPHACCSAKTLNISLHTKRLFPGRHQDGNLLTPPSASKSKARCCQLLQRNFQTSNLQKVLIVSFCWYHLTESKHNNKNNWQLNMMCICKSWANYYNASTWIKAWEDFSLPKPLLWRFGQPIICPRLSLSTNGY